MLIICIYFIVLSLPHIKLGKTIQEIENIRVTKRKKKRISEKMRRHNLSLQRPYEEFRRRVIESERMRKEREPEERRRERWRKWKKWLGLADFTEYDGPFPIFICAVLFLVIFLSGISLIVLGLFKDPYKIQRLYL